MRRNWAAARKKVDREQACRVCGATWGVQAAHVVPRSLGGGMTEEDIVPLCPDHHRLYDDHRLDLLAYLYRSEETRAVEILGLERARKRLNPSDYRLPIERARRRAMDVAA